MLGSKRCPQARVLQTMWLCGCTEGLDDHRERGRWPFAHQHCNHRWWPRWHSSGTCSFLSSRYSEEQKGHVPDLPWFEKRGATALLSHSLDRSPAPVQFRRSWAWPAAVAACSMVVLAVQHSQGDYVCVFTCECTGQHYPGVRPQLRRVCCGSCPPSASPLSLLELRALGRERGELSQHDVHESSGQCKVESPAEGGFKHTWNSLQSSVWAQHRPVWMHTLVYSLAAWMLPKT